MSRSERQSHLPQLGPSDRRRCGAGTGARGQSGTTREAAPIRPLTRREYRVAVTIWEELINTFPWDRAPDGPDTTHDSTVELLASLTIAICDYEEATPIGRLRRRVAAPPDALALATLLDRHGADFRTRAPALAVAAETSRRAT
jgi:hypothetical protein